MGKELGSRGESRISLGMGSRIDFVDIWGWEGTGAGGSWWGGDETGESSGIESHSQTMWLPDSMLDLGVT